MRVLRPLRSVNAFPKMRRLIGSLLSSLPSLGNAVVFMFFIFLLFGILGVQQFGGKLYQRCRTDPAPTYDAVKKWWHWPAADGVERLCSLDDQGAFRCPAPFTCGSPTSTAHFLTHEAEGVADFELISFDIANFNHLLTAMNTIFVMITLEGWTIVMYNLSDSSQTWMAVLFCILLVVVGSFFLLNVILAVIMDAFNQNIEAEAHDTDEKKVLEAEERRKAYAKVHPDLDLGMKELKAA